MPLQVYHYNLVLRGNKVYKIILNLSLSILVLASFTFVTRYILGVEFGITYAIPFISGIGAVLCYMIITLYNSKDIKVSNVIKSFIIAITVSTIILIIIYNIKSNIDISYILKDELIGLFSIFFSNLLMIDSNGLSVYLNDSLTSITCSNYSPDRTTGIGNSRDGGAGSSRDTGIGSSRDGGAGSSRDTGTGASNTGQLIRRGRNEIISINDPNRISNTSSREMRPIDNIASNKHESRALVKRVSIKQESDSLNTNVPIKQELSSLNTSEVMSYSNTNISHIYGLESSFKLGHIINLAYVALNTDYNGIDVSNYAKHYYNPYFYKSYGEFIHAINVRQVLLHYPSIHDFLREEENCRDIYKALQYQNSMYCIGTAYQYVKNITETVVELKRNNSIAIDDCRLIIKNTIWGIQNFNISSECLERLNSLITLSNISIDDLEFIEDITDNMREELLTNFFKLKQERFAILSGIHNKLNTERQQPELDHAFNMGFGVSYVEDHPNTMTYMAWLEDYFKHFEEDFKAMNDLLYDDHGIRKNLKFETKLTRLNALGVNNDIIKNYKMSYANYIYYKNLYNKYLDKIHSQGVNRMDIFTN